ncbi:hypothetical protein Ahy_A04g021233 [Arachis hypogaea]|uniref:F-box/LRR-repeat protein n=1 Tax=Arachis hypogaea TaxID=3818 RepID=A0A445DK29_ARAHY|nr:hypothetical protein Ahy_A04g021233 [Arachis hypogaea]
MPSSYSSESARDKRDVLNSKEVESIPFATGFFRSGKPLLTRKARCKLLKLCDMALSQLPLSQTLTHRWLSLSLNPSLPHPSPQSRSATWKKRIAVGCSRLERLSLKWCFEISDIGVDLLCKKCFYLKVLEVSYLKIGE